jgi:hypothetical protein
MRKTKHAHATFLQVAASIAFAACILYAADPAVITIQSRICPRCHIH